MILNALPRYHDTAAERLFHFTDHADLLSPALIITALLDPGNLTQADSFTPPQSQSTMAGQQRLRLARQLRKFGEVEAARSFAQQALRLDAGLSGAHELLAWLDLDHPKTKDRPAVIARAIFHAQRAVDLDAAKAGAWLVLARAQVLSGNWQGVRQSAATALSLGLTDPLTARQMLEWAADMLPQNPGQL
jgi:tetratricopeptide (TPR) repeat protein